MTAPARIEPESLLLTEDEAAARLKISARTLRDLRKAGSIRYVQITARKIGYRPEDCAEYVASRVRTESAALKPSPSPKRTRSKRAPVFGNVLPFSQRKKAG